jgi:hypothetical protein
MIKIIQFEVVMFPGFSEPSILGLGADSKMYIWGETQWIPYTG